MQQEEEQYSCLEEFFIDSCRFGDYDDAIGCFEDDVDLFWIDINQNNCFHMVSANGHLSILEQIIQYSKKKNIDLHKLINHQNQYGCTPLHWAVFNNQIAIIPVLLQNGADVTIKNLNGLTCIDEAVSLDKIEVVVRSYYQKIYPYQKINSRPLMKLLIYSRFEKIILFYSMKNIRKKK